MVLSAAEPALLMKLPVAAATTWPLAWLLETDDDALRVMFPPVTKATLSVNELAPPTVMAPASDAPKMIELKPSLKTDVPVNKLVGKDTVPLPVPTPMEVAAVDGRTVKMPLLLTAELEVPHEKLSAAKVMLLLDVGTSELACCPNTIKPAVAELSERPALIVMGPVLARATKLAAFVK